MIQGFKCWSCETFVPRNTSHGNFCNKDCQTDYRFKQLYKEWAAGTFTWNIEEKAPLWIYEYLLEERGRNCERCGIHTWNGVPVKIRVDKADHTLNDMSESNLLLVCPNCKKHKVKENE